MVNALVKLDENVNRILNLVKARYNLKDKSEAIGFIINKYADDEGEPELRPEFIKKILKTENEKTIRLNSIEDLRKRYNAV